MPTQAEVDNYSQAQMLIEAGLMDEFLDGLDDDAIEQLLWDWQFWRRPNQAIPPGSWDVWVVLAGRGYGKTRTGAETMRHWACSGTYGRMGIVAPTAGDARDIMVEGESGILAISPRDQRPKYEPSKRRLTWPNGARATVFSGEDPDRLRGPQHEAVWVDEPASMDNGEETVDNARLGLRLGKKPRLMVTGTPKRRPWLRALIEEPVTTVTTGSTYENLANLAESFIQVVLGRYEGTRLGLQELHAVMLDDVEGAMWTELSIDLGRIVEFNKADPWTSLNVWLLKTGRPIVTKDTRAWRTIVAVDPPGETAECGIVVAAAPRKAVAGIDHAVVLADASMAGRPEEWAAQVIATRNAWGAEAVYVESNQGGDMVRSTIHAVDPTCPVKKITAVESKTGRAEPVAALYPNGWIHHAGYFVTLEDQMTTWVKREAGKASDSKSPDRLDALVHAIRELLGTATPPSAVSSPVRRRLG